MNGPYRCLLSVALLAESCALTSRGTSLTPRYFDVAVPPMTASGVAAPMPAPAEDATERVNCTLRLGAIGAQDGIDENILYRTSAHEIGRYESRRWNARPEEFLERALVRRLFDAGRCRRVLSGVATTLDARIIAFEEQRERPDCAHVAVHIIISDGRTALQEETIDRMGMCRPATTEAQRFEEFVRAISLALDDVVGRIVTVVCAAAHCAAQSDSHRERGR